MWCQPPIVLNKGDARLPSYLKRVKVDTSIYPYLTTCKEERHELPPRLWPYSSSAEIIYHGSENQGWEQRVKRLFNQLSQAGVSGAQFLLFLILESIMLSILGAIKQSLLSFKERIERIELKHTTYLWLTCSTYHNVHIIGIIKHKIDLSTGY